MSRRLLNHILFVSANVLVMIILHGNSRQFWPKIPYLSLRNESVGEHCRLLFNTLLLVTLGQMLLGKLPRDRRMARAVVLGAMPASLPALIWFGRRVLGLRGRRAEAYYLALVPLLPFVGVVIEELLVQQRVTGPTNRPTF